MKTDSAVMDAPIAPVEAVEPSRCAGRRFRRALQAVDQIRLVALRQFGDRLRSGWVIACMVVWLGAICLTSFFGLLQIGHMGAQGFERTVVSLLSLAQYLIPLLGLLLGHDLIVTEREERTVRLLLAGGLGRSRFIFGKFCGECLTLSVPLAAGFLLSGIGIGLATQDRVVASFLKLAGSGLILGILFLALGLLISVFSRSRVQALVLALIAWCFFVFVFDLVALGITISSKAAAASNEVELVCDANHVNAAADLHSAYEAGSEVTSPKPASSGIGILTLALLALNPVDLFRMINLPSGLAVEFPWLLVAGCALGWLAITLSVSRFKFQNTDL